MGTLSIGRFFIPLGRISTRIFEFHWEIWSLHRERRALQSLDDHALKDLGLSRADVDNEVGKPFWRR